MSDKPQTNAYAREYQSTNRRTHLALMAHPLPPFPVPWPMPGVWYGRPKTGVPCLDKAVLRTHGTSGGFGPGYVSIRWQSHPNKRKWAAASGSVW